MTNLAERALTWVIERRRARLPQPAEPNPWLIGPFAPVEGELTARDLAVEGELPAELDGLYARIGPNPLQPANPATYHWFLGDGMVHGVRLQGGRALWYRRRYIRSTSVSAGLGEPPAPGPRRGVVDTVNTNIIGHAGRLLAMVESGPLPVELDPELNTLRHSDLDGTLGGSFTAHPHRDPDSGELHAICYDAKTLNRVRYVVVGNDGRVRRTVEVPVRHGPSIHDCAITQRYVVILDLPVTFSFRALLDGWTFPYRWNPDHRARVGLLPRDGEARDVIWCDVDPCYVFHPCNAFDLPDGRVVIDVVAHDRMFHASPHGPDSERAPFERWTCDPSGRRVERQLIDERPQEFPRLDERLTGKPYRYAYTVARSGPGERSALLKHDLVERRTRVHQFGAAEVAGEFVFVPRRGGTAEDDGWLMGLVTDAAADAASLVLLDAQAFEAPPTTVVRLPHRVPLGFHGNWITGVA